MTTKRGGRKLSKATIALMEDLVAEFTDLENGKGDYTPTPEKNARVVGEQVKYIVDGLVYYLGRTPVHGRPPANNSELGYASAVISEGKLAMLEATKAFTRNATVRSQIEEDLALFSFERVIQAASQELEAMTERTYPYNVPQAVVGARVPDLLQRTRASFGGN